MASLFKSAFLAFAFHVSLIDYVLMWMLSLLVTFNVLFTHFSSSFTQAMMKDQFANYVVQKVLETCSDQQRELILSRIKVHLNALKKYTYGKHIVARVEKLVAAGGKQLFRLYLTRTLPIYLLQWYWMICFYGCCRTKNCCSVSKSCLAFRKKVVQLTEASLSYLSSFISPRILCSGSRTLFESIMGCDCK